MHCETALAGRRLLASRCKALSRKCEFAGCDQQRRQVTANASKIKDSAIRGVSNDCSEVRQSGFTRVRQGWGNASRVACATNIHFSIFGFLGPWQFLNIGHQGPHARTSTAILAFHAQTGHRVLAVSQNPCFTYIFFYFSKLLEQTQALYWAQHASLLIWIVDFRCLGLKLRLSTEVRHSGVFRRVC